MEIVRIKPHRLLSPRSRRDRNARRNSPEGDRLDVLVTRVETWERKHHPLDLPDQAAALHPPHIQRLGLLRGEPLFCLSLDRHLRGPLQQIFPEVF